MSLGLATVATVLMAPLHDARACGGTFCDNVTGMPVDQTGENILFVVDGDRVQAHIQIQYDPEAKAETFAWVVPVMAVPEFAVGSERLFENMLRDSVPFYGTRNVDICSQDEDGGGDDGGDGDGDGDDDETGGDDDPNVVKQVSVGAFEIAVLQGGTVDGVMQWLEDNGFAQDPAARPILDVYLQEGFLFVAMRLANAAQVDEIQPIVLSYANQEPCVPLRLTQIAAVEDMHIRTFFLGAQRFVPENYRHVEVNPLKIDWLRQGENYPEVVAMAVDAEHALGNAFVTEFAGPGEQIQSDGLFDDDWDPDTIAALQNAPTGIVDVLKRQDLMACYERNAGPGGDEWTCEYYHPLIAPLLRKYMPVPDGLEADDFYSCLSCFVDQINLDAWVAEDFAEDVRERIVEPGKAALELVEQQKYLTRMYTRISPSEMNADPVFIQASGLGDVANVRVAMRNFTCDGGSIVELPDGRAVHIPAGEGWPEFTPEMPWEERVQLARVDGGLDELVSRTLQIDQILAAWNGDHPLDDGTETGTTTGVDETGATSAGTATGADTTGSTGVGGTGGPGTDGPDSDDGDDSTGDDLSIVDAGSGCACSSRVAGDGAPSLLGWATLLLAGLGRRRK